MCGCGTLDASVGGSPRVGVSHPTMAEVTPGANATMIATSHSLILRKHRRIRAIALATAAALITPAAAAVPAFAVGAPSTPTLSSISAGSTQLTGAWTAPASNGGAAITSYTVACTPASGAAVTRTVTMPAALTAAVTGLTNGTNYSCRVKATNGTDSAWSNALSATPRTTPGTPTISAVTPGNLQLSLALTPNGTGGAAITSYAVTCVGPATVTVRTATSPVIVRPLLNGASYACTAVATNAAGSSVASAPSSGTPADIVPIPTALSITPSNATLRASFTPGAVNGSAPVVGYRLSCTNAGVTASATATTSPVTLTGLTNGREYDCVVRAYTQAGSTSVASTSVTVTPRTISAAPVIGGASAGSQAVTVTFTQVPDSANGGAAISGYTATCIGATVTKRASVAADQVSVTVTSLANGVVQSCTVTAQNTAGSSPASLPVLATPRTTATVPGTPTASPRNLAAALAWSAPASNGGAAITDYVIEGANSTDTGATWSAWSTVEDGVSATPSALLGSLTNGTAYRYRVSAINAAGSSATSAVSTSVTPRSTPAAPSVTATPLNGAAQLTFSAPVSNGATITGYAASCRAGTVTRSAAGLPTPVAGVYKLTVAGLTNGTEATCTVTAQNAAGSSAASGAVTVTPRTTPSAPAITSVTSVDSALRVEWSTPSATGGASLDEYLVTCTRSSITPVTETVVLPAPRTAEVGPLTNGLEYSCTVRAHNIAGYSTASAAVIATPRRVPDAPVAGAASIESSTTTVSFTPVPSSGNGGAPISGYIVTCAATGADTRQSMGVTTPLIVRNLSNGTLYDCTIVALNIVGASAPSATLSVTPRTIATMATDLAVTPGNAEVALSWTAPLSDGGASITDYAVQWSTNSGAAWTTFTHDPITGTSATVTDLTNGTAYRFRVAPVNDRGTATYSRSSLPVIPRTTPDAPTGLSGTAGNTQVALTWTAPASNGGMPVTDYVVRISTDDGATWSIASDPVTPATGLNVTGLTNGSTYQFKVEAVNVAGASMTTDPTSSLTPLTVPSAPTGLSATPENTQVALTWTAPSGDGGAAITDYTIQVTADAGTTWSAVTHDPDTTTSLTVTGLTNGTRYKFKVSAVNVAGTSRPSTQTASVTPRTTPDAPDAPSLTPENTTLTVAWTAVTGAATGGAQITGYGVTCTDGTTPSTVSASASPAILTSLTNGTAYDCTVMAYNIAGASNASSATTATPRTVPGAPSLDTLTVADTSLTLAFTAPASDGGAPITSYMATCTAPDGTEVATTATEGDPDFPPATLTVTGLSNGTTYSCTLVAANVAGDGDASNAETATPVTNPDAPTVTAVTAHNGELEVAFTAPTNVGGTVITAYTVTCTDGATPVTETGATSPVTVTGLTNGTEYSCTVIATNAVGNSTDSNAGGGTPVTTPEAPTLDTLTASSGQLEAAFSEPAQNGGSAITAYTVTCSDGVSSLATTGATSPLTVTGLANATEYSCTVTATNAVGTSEASGASTATPYTVPGAPSLETVTRGDTSLTVAFTLGSANGRPVTSMTVTCDDGDTPVTVTDDASPVIVTGLTNGTDYACAVTATNEAGTSAPSGELSGTPATVADTPVITETLFEGTQVTVTFDAPVSDGGSPVTAYTVYCAPVASGDTPDPVTLDEATPAPVTVTGLTEGATYTCWVVATNAVGDSSPA